MNERLVHRGPDDEGYWVGEGMGLATRRLSIIDVAGGHQPLSNEDSSIWITYNGEIYNHESLGVELRGRGHTFRTRSDTEMVVHAYEEWGPDCLQRFRGMFAFALYDERRKKLLLARDRFGKKPLYYAETREGLLFASEIRPLVEAGNLPRRADPLSLHLLFSLGFIPSPRTMFGEVKKLPAAHYMIAECHEGNTRLSPPQPFWHLPNPPGHDAGESPPSLSEAIEHTRTLLREAVSLRRLSEVPLGALLSGGLDSTTVTAVLQDMAAEPLHTVSIAFDEPGYDESAHSRLAAERLGTLHHVFRFGLSDFERLPEVVAHLEGPQCSATSLPIYLLYQACREAGLTVVLTGEGADELFFGYHWYRGEAWMALLLRMPKPLRQVLSQSPLPISPAARRVLDQARPNDPAAERYRLWQQVLSGPERRRLMARSSPEETFGANPDWPPAKSPDGTLAAVRRVESGTRMVDFINFEVDRMSMAHSVEARMPFLDHVLWEYVCQLPEMWLRAGHQEKSFLREVARPWIPRETLRRSKRGLAAPHARWLQQAHLPSWAEEALHPSALEEAGYFQVRTVKQMRSEHQAGRADYGRALMGVLSTQLWHQQFEATS